MDTPKGWGGDKISAVHHLPWPFAVAVGPNRRSIVGDTMAERAVSAIRPALTCLSQGAAKPERKRICPRWYFLPLPCFHLRLAFVVCWCTGLDTCLYGVLWEVCVVRWCWWGSLCCGEGGSWAMWWASLRFGYQLVVNDSIE